MYEVWTLVKALWGKHEGRFGLFQKSLSSFLAGLEKLREGANYRHFSISEWFKLVSDSNVTKELQSQPAKRSEKEAKNFAIFHVRSCQLLILTFENLTGKRIKQAVDTAIINNDLQFSGLLAQAASNSTSFQQRMAAQISVWENTKQFDTLPQMRKNIYHILAGHVDK